MKKRIVIGLIPLLLFFCLVPGRPEPSLAKSGNTWKALSKRKP